MMCGCLICCTLACCSRHGARLSTVDDSDARKVSGFVQTVRKDDFLAVVARTEWAAIKAAEAMRVTWTSGTKLLIPPRSSRRGKTVPIAQGGNHADRRQRAIGAGGEHDACQGQL